MTFLVYVVVFFAVIVVRAFVLVFALKSIFVICLNLKFINFGSKIIIVIGNHFCFIIELEILTMLISISVAVSQFIAQTRSLIT
jgi:hypothetical protein